LVLYTVTFAPPARQLGELDAVVAIYNVASVPHHASEATVLRRPGSAASPGQGSLGRKPGPVPVAPEGTASWGFAISPLGAGRAAP